MHKRNMIIKTVAFIETQWLSEALKNVWGMHVKINRGKKNYKRKLSWDSDKRIILYFD